MVVHVHMVCAKQLHATESAAQPTVFHRGEHGAVVKAVATMVDKPDHWSSVGTQAVVEQHAQLLDHRPGHVFLQGM